MVDFVVLVLIVVHKLLKFFAEKVNFAKIEWSEIGEKWLVNEIVVNAEIECVLARLGWVLVADPVEAPWDNFYGPRRIRRRFA